MKSPTSHYDANVTPKVVLQNVPYVPEKYMLKYVNKSVGELIGL